VHKDHIAILVDKGLEELGFQDCFLIDTNISNKKIEVFLDSDEQVTFKKCQKLSRYLEAILDENKWFGESYILEVSSAGVGTPLKYARQYIKNIGRKIEVKSEEGTFKGVLAEANDQGIKITWTEREKQGKKKVNVDKEKILRMEDILKAKIKISF
jgi:ribosome maturation factor RimP